jgi:hypothetical protein
LIIVFLEPMVRSFLRRATIFVLEAINPTDTELIASPKDSKEDNDQPISGTVLIMKIVFPWR